VTVPISLAGAAWLEAAATQRLLAVLAVDGDEARVVGGAVRNALLGEAVEELDVATTATPDRISFRAEAAGFKAVPTGIEHGTITVVVDGTPFEVTTLRRDVETDGRRAKVVFGRDWDADAHRRDFTVNALSVTADGALHDPVGGYRDCVARRIRFIGDAEARIREDHLRILRFFRFHARFGAGAPDGDGLAAAMRLRHGLRALSAERVGQEMRKLVVAAGAPATVVAMSDAGLLQIALGGVARLDRFARHAALTRATGGGAAAAPALAALAVWLPEDVERLATRLRLSNAERQRMRAAAAAAADFARGGGPRADRARRWRLGAEACRDGLLICWADALDPGSDADWRARLALAESFAPVLPVAGRDLVAAGIPPGPEVGRRLAALEALWIESDFALGRDELLSALRRPC
jgi:poly(A) polymerase